MFMSVFLKELAVADISPVGAFTHLTSLHIHIFDLWRLLGPAQIAIAAIFGAIGFIWIIVLPYLSWRLIKYIAKNKVQRL